MGTACAMERELEGEGAWLGHGRECRDDLVFAQRIGAHRRRWMKGIKEATISGAVARLGGCANMWRSGGDHAMLLQRPFNHCPFT
jgi:hypothetical protein